MTRRVLIVLLPLLITLNVAAQDWRQWRGPKGNNHATSNATAPLEWSEDAGLAWKVELPGRGNSSATIVGDRIYLTTGDEEAQTQSLLIHDRGTGELIKTVITHRGNLPDNVQAKNSHANATVASDGERLFVLFLNDGAPTLTAYDLQGEQLWQKRTCGETKVHFEYGWGNSPRLVDGLVVVSTEFGVDGSGLYAFDAKTGEEKWHAPRPKQHSYSSPSEVTFEGKKMLLMCGNNQFVAYDVKTGKELWKREGPTLATVGTMTWDADLGLGFASGGHPDQFTLAVSLSGDHEITWRNPVKCYEQSLLSAFGCVYATSDQGVAYCWKASSGDEIWKKRLGGNFSSSPVLVGKKIYATNEQGAMFVYEANQEQYVQLAKNQLGDICYATPTPADGRLYHRYGKDGKEYLAAIGKK